VKTTFEVKPVTLEHKKAWAYYVRTDKGRLVAFAIVNTRAEAEQAGQKSHSHAQLKGGFTDDVTRPVRGWKKMHQTSERN